MPQFWILKWLNPYTEPPNGQPREMARMTLPWDEHSGACRPPQEMLDLHAQQGFGSGYFLSWGCEKAAPPKRWSPERKFKYRRGRLEARVRKKYPLFADQFVAEVLAAKPDYYGLSEQAHALERQKIADERKEFPNL